MSSSSAKSILVVCQLDFFRANVPVATLLSSMRNGANKLLFTGCTHGEAVLKAIVHDLESAGWDKENIMFAPVDESYKARPDLVRDALVQSSLEMQVAGLHVIRAAIEKHSPDAILVAGDRSSIVRVGKFLRHSLPRTFEAPLYALPPMDAAVGGGPFYKSICALYDNVFAFGAEFAEEIAKACGEDNVVALPLSMPSKGWGDADTPLAERRKAAREKHMPKGLPEDAFVFSCLSAPIPENRLDHAIELFLVVSVTVEKAYMLLYTHGAASTTDTVSSLADTINGKCSAAAQSIVANQYKVQKEEQGDDFKAPDQKEIDEKLDAVRRELLSRFCIVTRNLSREGLVELAACANLGISCTPSYTYDIGALAHACAGVPVMLPGSVYTHNMFGRGDRVDKVALPTRETPWISAKLGTPYHDSAIITYQSVPSVDERGSIAQTSKIPEIKNAFNIVVDPETPEYEELIGEIDTAEGDAPVDHKTPQKPSILSSGFVIAHRVKTYAEALEVARAKIHEHGQESAVQIVIQCQKDAAFVYNQIMENINSPLLKEPQQYAAARIIDPAFAVILHTQHIVTAGEVDLQKAAVAVSAMCKKTDAERDHVGNALRELARSICDDAGMAVEIVQVHLDGSKVEPSRFPVAAAHARPLPPPPAPVASNTSHLIPGSRAPEAEAAGGAQDEEEMPPLADTEPLVAPAPQEAQKKRRWENAV